MGLTRALSTGSLTSALKQFSKGLPFNEDLPGAKHATDDLFVMQEESGEWRYLVIDPKGIRARDDPSYTRDTKNSELSRYPEGTVIEIDRRRRVGWTIWLRVKSALHDGWVFDVSPKDKKVRMVQVEVTSGQWMYEACIFQRVPVLRRPTMATSSTMKLPMGKQQPMLENREVVSVTERVRPVSGKGTFLRLADGRGWVLDYAAGHRVMQRWKYPNLGMFVAEDSSNSSECSQGQLSGTGKANQCHDPLEAMLKDRFTSLEKRVSGMHKSQTDDGVTGNIACIEGTTCMEPIEVDKPEFGSWDYVVLDARGISLRDKPTYDPSHKISRRVEEGEIVEVKERRADEGTTFLRLACPQGWVFDRQPGSDSRVRMMQVEIQRGVWHYMVVAPHGVALRTRCSFSDETKCGQGPLKGAIIEVSARVKVGETMFLQLKEGGRWVFDKKGGRKIIDGPVSMLVQPEGTKATVKPLATPTGVQLLSAPTNLKWAAGKMRLLPQAQVQVKAFLDHECRTWCYVTKPGSGMQGWMSADDLEMEAASNALAGEPLVQKLSGAQLQTQSIKSGSNNIFFGG